LNRAVGRAYIRETVPTRTAWRDGETGRGWLCGVGVGLSLDARGWKAMAGDAPAPDEHRRFQQLQGESARPLVASGPWLSAFSVQVQPLRRQHSRAASAGSISTSNSTSSCCQQIGARARERGTQNQHPQARGVCQLLLMLCVCVSGGTMCFIGIECVRVCGPVRVNCTLTERTHPDHTKSPYHCSLEPALVADEQWDQQFTSEPPSRPCGPHDELSTAINNAASKTQPRPLPDVHQLCSARVTYEEGKITSKRKN
jgi:hypothetical protein